MKKVSLLILVSLILLLAFASCDKLPPLFGEEPEPEHVHDWMEATCEAPKTCACGATEGEKLPHTWTEATCSSPKVCTFCNLTEGSALNHKWVEADCETPATCSLCGETSGEALGHVWISASCDSPKHCAACNTTEGEALEHVWEEATCLTPRFCTLCKVVDAPALGHTEEKVPGYAATCTENGLSDGSTCTVCGETTLSQQVIPATGHTESDWIVDLTPDCDDLGSQHKECTVCHTTLYTESLSALGHTETDWIEDVPATCDEKGKQHKECTVCGKTTKTAAIPVLGHTASAPVKENEVAPDCENNGSYDEVIKCATCGCELARNTVEVSALGHKMVSATCQAPATCSVCGHTEGEVSVHKPGETKTENNVAPKCEEAGSYDLATYCVWCNAELTRQTVAVDALGHDMAPATCTAPSTCKNGCGKTEGTPLDQHTIVVSYSDEVLMYRCASCSAYFIADVAHYYDGTNKQYDFSKNGDIAVNTSNGMYEMVTSSDTRSQYMLYLPTSNRNNANIFTDFNCGNNATGAISFKVKANVTEKAGLAIMEARNSNPSWNTSKGWTDNSFNVFEINPAKDGKVLLTNYHGTDLATVDVDSEGWTGWIDVKMFIHLGNDKTLTISYYINDEFCNAFTYDLTVGDGGYTLDEFKIECVYINGWTTGKGTGIVFDDFAVGYTKDTEMVFDTHKHVWADATCTAPKTCTACGATEGEALGHDYVNHDGQAPTCTEKGWADYQTCNRCDLNTYTEIPATGHNYGNATCDQAAACTVCGFTTGEALGHEFKADAYVYNNDAKCGIDGTKTAKCSRCDATDTKTAEGTALEHNFQGATCANAATCTLCGISNNEFDYSSHKLAAPNFDGSKMVYSCEICSKSFAVETEGVYFDGTNMTGTTIGSYTGTAIGNYVGGSSKYNNGANKVVSDNGVWKAITDINATVNTESQVQLWLPQIKGADVGFKQFNAANASVGVISFDLKIDLAGKDDVFSMLVHKGANWSTDDGIRVDILSIKPIINDSGVTTGYNVSMWDKPAPDKAAYTVTKQLPVELVEGKTETEWFNVQVYLELDDATDAIYAYYFIDGVLFHVGSATNTVTTNALSCLYINLNAWKAGTGYYMDNFAYGHTVKGHYTFDGQEHKVTEATACNKPATCTCGWVGEGLPHDLTEATCAAPATCKNCGMTVGEALPHSNLEPTYGEVVKYTCSDCGKYYAVDGKGYYYDGTSMNGFKDVSNDKNKFGMVVDNGVYSMINSTNENLQGQLWYPTNDVHSDLDAFSCANNATGFLSFRINSGIAGTNNNDNLTFVLAMPRNDSANWAGWGASDINILSFGAAKTADQATISLRGGVENSNEIAQLPLENGWTGWVDVVVLIQLHDNNTITLTYYINDKYIGSYTGNMDIATHDIRALHVTGYTQGENSGFMLDDLAFGYTLNGLQTPHEHNWSEATCAAPATCTVCGMTTGEALPHNLTEATCVAPATCTVCGATVGSALPHSNYTISTADSVVTYTCVGCGCYYQLDENVTASGDYIKTADDTNKTRMEFWTPVRPSATAGWQNFSSANGGVGFLSFDFSAYVSSGSASRFIMQLAEGHASDMWSAAGSIQKHILRLASLKDNGDGTYNVNMLSFNDHIVKSFVVTAEDMFTAWTNFSVRITLDAATDTIIADYYVDGEFVLTDSTPLTTQDNSIGGMLVSCDTYAKDSGFKLQNFNFGYTVNGLHDAPVVEPPIYTEVIDVANVQSETLKTIVASKIKQCDQAKPSDNPDDLFLEGGTPVYVLADKNGETVEALYFSRTVAWTGKETKQLFTEFRFDVDGTQKATSISFDYKIKGTVEKNDRFTFKDLEGNAFSADAYVQIKTPANHPLAGDNYPELSGTDLILDGEWHIMTYTFAEPLEIINVLVNLYHFQGEMLISNFNVEFEEVKEPFYTEEIAKESVSSEILQTVVTNKIKQWDQSSAHNSHEGTPVFVKADMDGTPVTGLYFSKTTPWVGDEGEQFSEFRVNVDSSKKATGFTFVYKVEGTVDENKGSGNGGYTFKDLEGNAFTADAYVQIKTPKDHPLAGDNYPELSGTDFIIDGQWHIMSYTFPEALEITNILFNFYHFQGELIIAELEVTFVEECQHTNTTTNKVDPTCIAEGSNKVVCDDCGETLVDEVLPVVDHKTTYKVEGEGVVVSCAYGCGEGYTVAKGYYNDGTNNANVGFLAANKTAGYTTNANGSPVVVDGYHVFAREAGRTDWGQIQFHVRTAAWADADKYFPDFNAAAGATGVIAFKINPNLDSTGNLRFIITNRVESGFGWSGTHSIDILTFSPATADGKINVTGWGGNALATLEKGKDGYTGWIDVKITIELSVNENGQNIGLVKYYINGELVGTTHSSMKVVDGKFNNLYVTANSTEAGTGFMMDDLLFGYTPAHTHNFASEVTAPTCTEAGFTTFTCDCGESYTGNEVAALGHTGEATCYGPATCGVCGATHGEAKEHKFSTSVKDGKVTVSCANCSNSYICDTSYVYDGANTTWNWSQGETSDISLNVVDGEYVISANSEIPSQYMLYIPSSNRNYAMQGFAGATNSVGVISFRVKTDAQNYYDENGKTVQPGTVRFIFMEARNSNPDWQNWSNNSVDVLAIQPNNDGTYKVHGNSMTSDTLATVAANDWLDVQMFVTLSSAETMTITYYLNGSYCGSYTKDFNAENFGMRILSNIIESFYICGWTQGQGTGVVFDDLYIGYSAFGHWTFDAETHAVTEATSCTSPATCTCGWTGDVLPHDMTEASCAAPSTCKTCGFSTGEALHHNYTTLVNNGTVMYLCEDCNRCYTVTTGTLSDGNNPSDNVWKNFVGAGGAAYNGNGAYPALVEGADGNNYFQYLKAETTDSANQIQIWLPSSGGKGLQGFTADTNNVGFFSLDFNANMDHNCEWKFVDFSSDATRWSAEWCIDNPFFRMTTPADGKVELRGFNGVAFATVELQANNYTGWMNLAFMITLDAEQDLVIVDYYLNGQYKATMSAALTTKTNGICSVYMNGNAKAAGTGYMVDNIAFGYGSFGTHEHTWTNATCTTAKTCSGCGMTDGAALGHDFDVANCTSPKTCAICDATEGEALGHDMQAATCTSASKCSRCSHTEGEALAHADENGDYKCDSCSTKMLPAADEALTIAQAITIGKLYTKDTYTTSKYYITGVITEVSNTTYGNVVISDGTNSILVYGLYTYDGKTRYDAMTYKPVPGDEITVWGVIGYYTDSQMKNGWLDEVVQHAHDYLDATCEAPATCKLCGLTQGEKADHNYVDGTCTMCGNAEGVTIVEKTLSFSSKNNRTVFTTSQQVWAQNGVTLTNDKGSSTSNVADYAAPARFYKSSKITIDCAGMTKIVFDCNSASYATALKSSIGTVSGATITVSSDKVTIEFDTAVDTFVIANLSGGQVRMDSITVYAAE